MLFEFIETFFAGLTAIALLAFAGLALGGSAVGLVVCTPLFVIFSPILLPASIAATVLASGFLSSGSSGARALKIFLWLYKKYTGKEPPKIPGLTPPPALTSQPNTNSTQAE